MLKCVIIVIVCLEISSPTMQNDLIWSYDDETTWPGQHCKEGGLRQSPIDIRTSNVVTDTDLNYIKYGALKFHGYGRVLVSGINNEHTLQFRSEGEDAIHPILTGGPLEKLYRLEQMHFHWLSEHAINGIKYPMEIHFVHVRSDLSVIEALNEKDGLAIVAVFCNVQAELNEYHEEISNEIMQHVPNMLEAGTFVSGILLNMTKLLSPNMNSYYTYSGSLTSPECNEAVTWIIFDRPLYISDAQYRLFGVIGMGRHNFRSLKKLNRRTVYAPAKPTHALKFVIFIEDVYFAMKNFLWNITNFLRSGLHLK